jgi:hypothetical protein
MGAAEEHAENTNAKAKRNDRSGKWKEKRALNALLSSLVVQSADDPRQAAEAALGKITQKTESRRGNQRLRAERDRESEREKKTRRNEKTASMRVAEDVTG